MPCRNVNTKNQITLEPESYEICLPDWESVLPGLCTLIDAPYSTGAFEEAERQFVANGEATAKWAVKGASGCAIVIRLEQYEDYLFGMLSGRGRAYLSGKNYLWYAYLEQGGNPDAQERP